MGWMDWLKPAKRGEELPLPRQGNTFVLLTSGSIDTQPIKGKTEALGSYTGWVYACVSTLAQDVASNPWVLWQKAGAKRDDWKAVEDDKLHPALLRPNSMQTWGDFAELTAMHLDLTGEAYWHIMTSAPGGPAIGFQMVYPHWIQEPIIEGGRLVRWRVQIPGWAQEFIPAEDLVFLRYPHPSEPMQGASPVEAFAVSYDMDLYARAYGASLLKNRARPDGILTSDQELTREQADQIRTGWQERYNKPGEIAVLGKGSKYEALSVPLKDLEFLNLAQLTRDQILGIYKVPASKLGLVEDVNRANAEANDRTYKENAVEPRLRRIERAVNLYLLPRLKGLERGFYWEYESPVEDDAEQERAKANDALQRGAITVNEYRGILGMDKAADGDVYLIPSTVTPVKAILDARPSTPAKSEARGVRAEDTTEDERMEQAARRWLRRHGQLEQAMAAELAPLFIEEGEAVVAALEESGLRSVQTRDWLDTVLGTMRQVWARVMGKHVSEGLRNGWELAVEDTKRQATEWASVEAMAKEWAQRHAALRVTGIEGTTADEIRKVIAQAIANDLDFNQTAALLRELYREFSDSRAKMIARTEMGTALSRGKLMHAEEGQRRHGWNVRRKWVSLLDHRTRLTHQVAHGQRPNEAGKYLVGGSFLTHPGDPAGPAREIINCRCLELHEIEE